MTCGAASRRPHDLITAVTNSNPKRNDLGNEVRHRPSCPATDPAQPYIANHGSAG
jgi:hypothetical protein